uniref:NADH-ubiquinone oxidoreductase chain 4L n=1 Tax=Orthotrichia sp. XG-2021 TaxID=2996738 RepID=A0A9E8LP71_9NEOP|nr:NADH dehydrogenase subunit 4L [Orthotrichia sp. XG-2021]
MMVFKVLSLIMMMMLVGNYLFMSYRSHLLLILLSMEFLVLVIFFLMLLYLMVMHTEIFFLVLFLIFAVCEGVLAISLMIHMIRIYGNDYLFAFNLLC